MRRVLIFISIIFSSYAFTDGDEAAKNEINKYSISGIVKDKLTGEELAGVAIKIHSAGKTVYSDLEGRFEFRELAFERYDLTAEYISYEEITFRDIQPFHQSPSTDLIIQLDKKKPVN